MVNSSELSNKLAIDANNLNSLKLSAKENSPEAIKNVAKQFEAIFTNMMLKSMREATPQDSPFENEQSRTFTSMLDQQLSSSLATKGLGLAEVLTRQLSKFSNVVTGSIEQAVSGDSVAEKIDASLNGFIPSLLQSNSNSSIESTVAPSATLSNKSGKLSGSSAEFHERMSHHAEEASRATGVPAHLMLGQAALESGWGKREIKAQDGTPSNNLFGIKATGDWKGKVVETTTTEYIKGVKQKRVEKFRAYDSYADSFKDFANLIQNNPRYQKVMASLHDVKNYALAMQKSGYATDPNYATKLASVIRKVSA